MFHLLVNCLSRGNMQTGFLLRAFGGAFVLIHVYFNLLDLEAEDDGPDETQDHPWVAVHNILGSNVLQSHLPDK